jgi:FtsX extracellular domain
MPTTLFFRSSIPVIARLTVFACIATLLATLAVAGWYTQEREIATLAEQITLAVFFEQNATSQDIHHIETELHTISGVDSVVIKSPAIVRGEFVNRFATSIGAALPDNPFPAACLVHLKREARMKERIDTIAAEIRTLPSVEDVSYRAAFVSLVDARVAEALIVRTLAGVVVVLVLCALLWSALENIRLAETGLQPPALGILLGGLFGFGLSMAVFFVYRATLTSLDVVRPISLIAGSVIVCALGGLLLGIQAVLTVQNSNAAVKRVTNVSAQDSSLQDSSLQDYPLQNSSSQNSSSQMTSENTPHGGNYEPR